MANKKDNNPKDGLALIIGGIFILSLVFATYNYFNKGDEISNIDEINNETVFEDGENDGDLNGNGAQDQTFTTDSSLGTGGPIGSDSSWMPNDYNEGDIKGTSYTVVAGDTLWEIAEATYGNGADWVKILNANSDSIGYLANGQQALIRPGQVLVLP